MYTCPTSLQPDGELWLVTAWDRKALILSVEGKNRQTSSPSGKKKGKRRKKWFICFVVLAKQLFLNLKITMNTRQTSLKTRPLNVVKKLAEAFTKTQQHIKSLSYTFNYSLQSRVQNQPCFIRLSWTLERCLGRSEYSKRPLGCLKEVVSAHAKWTLGRFTTGVNAILTNHRKLASCG